MVRVGFIGVGGMGRAQTRAFTQVRGCRITAASDLSEQSLAEFSKLCPNARTYSDHRDLLNDDQVDAVVIAVPTHLHKPMAIAAMESGRPVLCEKPLGRTVADAREMITVSEKTGQLLMVAHCRRFDTDWGTFEKVFCKGDLGGPVVWRSFMAGPGPAAGWFMDDAMGGGPLMDGAVHNYDFANMLFGNPVEAIASQIKLTDSSAVDTATAVVRYEAGHQVMVSWSWGTAAIRTHVTDVLGPNGSLVFGPGPADTEGLDLQKFGCYCLVNRKTHKQRLLKFTRKPMVVTQAKHFVDCVNGKTVCRSPATEGIKAVAVAEAILKSARTCRPVKITW